MTEISVLDLRDLPNGIPALTKALGEVHAETAAVCMDHHKHKMPVNLFVRKVKNARYVLEAPEVTDAMRRTYADMQRTTELGACGIAILLVRERTGLTIVHQSWKGGGFDYWLGPDDSEDELVFQNTARLEVSGILSGTNSQFATRLKQKLKQMEVSDDTDLPGYAVVVEFGKPQAEMAKR